MAKVKHRRPYEKWERLAVVVAVVVAFVAVTFNHSQTSSSLDAPKSEPTSTQPSSSNTSLAPTNEVQESPLDDTSQFSIVAKADTDFRGTKLDKRMWSAYTGAGNEGVGTRLPSAISVNNGLQISAKGNVSGGMAQNYGQTYGRWIVRAAMEKGTGYGPAILLWPDSEKWPEDGEIDLVEMPRGDRSRALLSAHYGKNNDQQSHGVPGDFTQWHTFAIDWLPDRLTFYIDGVAQYEITDPAAIPTTPHHLAIQNDVGKCGSFIGCRDANTPETVSLYVSSVRVYSYNG